MKKITIWLFLLLITNSVFSQFGCGSAVVISDGYTATGITTPGNGGVEDWNTNPTGTSVNAFYWDDDVYLFQYTAGTNSEEITMSILSINSWNGIGIFSDCTGTTFSGELDAAAATGANTSKTVTAILSPNQTVYIAVGQWGAPNGLNFNVTSFSAIPLINPPSCVALSNPANGATNISSTQISWPGSNGGPDGYKLNVGTTSGGTDILNLFDVGNVLTYNFGTLLPNTTYYVTVVPYNANGDSLGCTESSFTTCGTNLAPWTYDVEAAGLTINSSIADCWSSIPTGTTSSYRWNVDGVGGTPTAPNTGPTGANSGVKYYYVEASSGTAGAVAELYTPLIDISSLTDASLQFHYHMFGSNMGDLHIDIFDGSSWVNDVDVIVGQQQTATGEPWLQRIVSLSAFSGTIRARFRAVRGNGGNGDISLDDILFDEAPSCLPPTNLTVYNITDTTIDIDWTENGSAFDWEYVVQPAGTGTPTGSGVAIDAQPWEGAISGLTSNTAYEVYIRSFCSVTSQSTWFGPVAFSTLCAPYSSPFLETFATNSLPSCWTQGGVTPWEYGSVSGTTPTGFADYGAANVADHSVGGGGTFIGIDGSDHTNGEVSTLLSPPIDVTTLGTPFLSYWVFSNNVNDAAQNQILVEFYDGASWNSIETIQANLGSDWVEFTTDLSTFSITGNVQVRFTVTGVSNGGSTFYNDILIDDVSIGEAPTCFAPNALMVSNLTSDSVDLSWTENGTATLWNIEYGISGFTQGAGTFISGVTTNPYSLTALTPNTQYQFYVQSDCGAVDGTSNWFGPFSFTTECVTYAAPFTEGFENGGTIPTCWTMTGSENWRFSNTGSGNHIGNNGVINGTTNTNGYFAWVDDSTPDTSDATLTSPFIDVSTLTVPRLTFYEISNNEGANPNSTLLVEVWDGAAWNTVGTYNTNTVAGWEKKIIDLSALTITGDIQVRFIIQESTSFYDDIAIDDVTVEETPQCDAPLALAASNITTTSADLSWNPVGTETAWNIEYGTSGFTPGSGTTVTGVTFPYNLSGLMANTVYQYYVQADCTTNGVSTWAGPFTFTTLCNPYTIPYFEGFESGYTQDVAVGGCLSQESVTAAQVWTANSTLTDYNRTPRTGSWNAYLQYGNDDWLFIPIDLVGGTSYTIELYARQDGATAANSNIAISYGTAATAAAMTNVITPPTGIVNGNYQQILGSFTPGTTGTYYVGIKGYMNFSPWYISLDDISIDVTPACQVPFGFAVSNLSSTGADISWSATGGNYEYVLDTNASDPATAGTPIAGETYNASGLTGQTDYYLHLRTDCGGGTYSAWVTYMFTTSPTNDNLCNAIPLTLGAATTGIDYTLVGATSETNEPEGSCFNGGLAGTVWFSFVAPASGSVEITTDFAGGTLEDNDTEIAVYDGTGVTCADLSTLPAQLACDQDSGDVNTLYGSFLSLTGLTSGTTYYIQVDSYGGVVLGTFGIQVNDLLSNSAFDLTSFKAYPNPVKDVLSLEYTSDITSVSVFNLLGQEVFAKTVNATTAKVDMSQLNSGAYIVNVTIDGVTQVVKVIKE